ncbi:MAG: hypothetical protein AAFV71_20255 [Cyanobacteria bacterium J06633_8]
MAEKLLTSYFLLLTSYFLLLTSYFREPDAKTAQLRTKADIWD